MGSYIAEIQAIAAAAAKSNKYRDSCAGMCVRNRQDMGFYDTRYIYEVGFEFENGNLVAVVTDDFRRGRMG